VLDTPAEVIRALKRCREAYDAASGSLLVVGRNGRDPHRDPFRRGFLEHLEERTELLRRMHGLDERDYWILIYWFVEDCSAVEIARWLRVSRVHCYRLRRAALECVVAMGEQREEVPDRFVAASEPSGADWVAEEGMSA